MKKMKWMTTPERRLCQAVLEQALLDLRRVRGTTRRGRGAPLMAEVVAWFWSTDATAPFSFEAVCAHLELDAAAVRRALRTADFSVGRVKNGRFQSPMPATPVAHAPCR